MDIAFVGVAAAVTLDDKGHISHAQLALGAVAPVPMRARQAEGLLAGNPPSEELFEAAGQAAADESQPIDDLRATAAYRRHLVGVLTRRALRQAVARARENHGIFA
jgi:carbon-monoxide dehydrogenase medium subunit